MPTAQLHGGTVVTLCTFRDALDGIGSGLKSIGAGVAAGVAGLVRVCVRVCACGCVRLCACVRARMYV